MAYLVKCSLCGRDVSSECNSCPGCGHNVAQEIRQKEFERKPIEERIVGEWKSDDMGDLDINKDGTFAWYFFDGSIRNRGRYSISDNKFNILSSEPFKLASAKISLKGDTLEWNFEDGLNQTDIFTRI